MPWQASVTWGVLRRVRKISVWCVLCIRDTEAETRQALEAAGGAGLSPPLPLAAPGAAGLALRLGPPAAARGFPGAGWHTAGTKQRGTAVSQGTFRCRLSSDHLPWGQALARLPSKRKGRAPSRVGGPAVVHGRVAPFLPGCGHAQSWEDGEGTGPSRQGRRLLAREGRSAAFPGWGPWPVAGGGVGRHLQRLSVGCAAVRWER